MYSLEKGNQEMNIFIDVDKETREVQKVASYAFFVNLGLAGMKLVLALLSGSLAVAASAIDSATDSVASLAAYGGIRLSSRRSRKFPYGLYKVENIISIVVAFFILFAGYEIARHVMTPAERPPDISVALIIWFLASVLVTFLFGQYAIFIGKRTGSPMLMAEGRHRQADVLSSVVVLMSVVLGYLDVKVDLFGITIDQIAAAFVLIFIGHAGWELLSNGMRVLLDASIDPETLNQVRKIIEEEPTVTEVRRLVGRNAGRFRFLETDVALRTDDLEKAHAVSKKIESNIRKKVPHVERIVIHYEPEVHTYMRVAVPLADSKGKISEHFGEAPYFALIVLHLKDKRIEKQEVIKNPYTSVRTAKGIRVAEWLVEHKIDEIVVKEDIKHKGPWYVFLNAGVRDQIAPVNELKEAVDYILRQNQ